MARCKMDQPERAAYLRVFCAHLLTDEDFETLTREQFGSACLLMFQAWVKQGSLPSDPRKLAGLAKCTLAELEELRTAWPKLVPLEDLDPTAEPGARVTIPYLWKEWQQVMGFYEGQRVRSAMGVAARKAAKGGPKGGPRGEPMGKPKGNPQGEPNQDQDQDQDQKKRPTTATRKRATAKKPETLEDILGGGKGTPTFEAYWKLVGTFGGQPKNPAPKTTAQLYAHAIAAGSTPEIIQAKAEALRSCTSEARFMPQLEKWLTGQGYLTPDSATKPSPTQGAPNGNRSPQHRAEVDAAYLEQLHQRPAPAFESAAALSELWQDPAHP